jgi:hypothetical protein
MVKVCQLSVMRGRRTTLLDSRLSLITNSSVIDRPLWHHQLLPAAPGAGSHCSPLCELADEKDQASDDDAREAQQEAQLEEREDAPDDVQGTRMHTHVIRTCGTWRVQVVARVRQDRINEEDECQCGRAYPK